MGAVTLLTAVGLSAHCLLTAAQSVDVPDRFIRVRDAVQLDCVPASQRGHIGELVVAALPLGAREIQISRQALATLARRRVPGLGELAIGDSNTAIAFRSSHINVDPDAVCYALARPVRAGEAITLDALSQATCDGASRPSLIRYDSDSGVVRAQTDLEAGLYLGRLHVPPHRFADIGDQVVLTETVGVVRIDRAVEALQAAPFGGAIFVRDEDGEIFSAATTPTGSPGK